MVLAQTVRRLGCSESAIGEKGVLPSKRGKLSQNASSRKGRHNVVCYPTAAGSDKLPRSRNEIRQQIERLWEDHREALEQVVLEFVRAEISPATMFDFETRIAERVRELARQLVENVLNLIEADDPEKMPHDLEHQGGRLPAAEPEDPQRPRGHAVWNHRTVALLVSLLASGRGRDVHLSPGNRSWAWSTAPRPRWPRP